MGETDRTAPPQHADRFPVLTVADALALPVLAAGQPQVLAGESRLDRPVRWVHITELTDPASFLKGGELVLTTGMPLPEEPARVRRYVDELAAVGAAALVLELVRRYHRPPEALIRACRNRDLPLVTLARDVSFVEVTQVIHALLLGNQTEALRRTQRIHEVFTALTLRGAAPEEVLRTAAEMSGHTMVLENLVHQAMICAPAASEVGDALRDWARRSRATPPSDQCAMIGPEGWMTAPVAYRGEPWGRVVMLPPPTHERKGSFGADDVTVLERTAMALTIARLIHPVTWERAAHRSVLRDLVEQRHRSVGEARARVAALGLPAETERFLSVLVDTGNGGDEKDSLRLEEQLAEELAATVRPALVGELTPGRIGILLALRAAQPWRSAAERLAHIARSLHPDAVVSVASEPMHVAQTARAFREAARVAEAIPPGSVGKSFYELSDIGLPQLLYALREDVRIQDYVERQIGRLVAHDDRHGTGLVSTLRDYLDAAGNKTTAARRGNLSRQTLYQRLQTIERLLGRDLESGDQRAELHVALIALDALRSRRTDSG